MTRGERREGTDVRKLRDREVTNRCHGFLPSFTSLTLRFPRSYPSFPPYPVRSAPAGPTFGGRTERRRMNERNEER